MIARLSPPVLLLLIALVIVLLIVLVMVVLWRTKARQDDMEAKQMNGEPESEPESASTAEAAPVNKKGAPAMPAEAQTSASVLSAVQFVRENSAGLGGRYRTPWFLLLGASGSGKSTLLEHSGIGLSLRKGTTNFGVASGIQWRFFDAGVIVDVPGNFFIRGAETGSDARNFKALLRNLVSRRPQRPIDGVVLTIPCTELFGPNALSPAVVSQRAAHIFDQLWMIEKWVGLSFPVYVIVTKCDVIPGFSSLARQLPARYRREIFGWSNPYNLEAAFEQGWIDQGFDELAKDLNRLQSEVFVAQRSIADVDDIFLFSGKLQQLRRPLQTYLARIFKTSAYRESLRFRGFYFIGDGPAETVEIIEPQRALAGAASGLWTETEPSFSIVPGAMVPGDVLGLSPAPEAQAATPIFVADLFEEKIFPERNVARPVTGVRLSKNRWMLGTQTACAVTVIVLAIGMTLNYLRLEETKNAFAGILDRLTPALERVQRAKNGGAGVTQLTPDDEDIADQLLRTVQSAPGYRFKTVFYPTSLADPLDVRLQNAMVPIFNNLVLPSFRRQLLVKSRKLLESNTSSGGCNQAPAYMRELAAYQELCGFSADLLQLERRLEQYNVIVIPFVGNVPSAQDLRDLDEVEIYLTNHALPNNFDQNPYFQVAFARALGCEIHPSDLPGNAAETQFKGLIQPFFEQWFTANPAMMRLDQLKKRIDDLDKPQSFASLEETKGLLDQVKAEAASPEFAWMGKDSFELTTVVEQVTDQVIDKSRLFFTPARQTVLKRFVRETGDREFALFTSKRSAETTAAIGQLLSADSRGVRLSDNAEHLRLYLENLLKQPFAQRGNGGNLSAGPPAGTQLIWNKDLLREAATLPDRYREFIKPVLTDLPPSLQVLFTSIALDRLEAGVLNLVAQAQSVQPLPSSEQPEQAIVPELQSFEEISAPLESLLQNLRELELDRTYNQLLRLTVFQASNLLRRIDASFNAQSPYETVGQGFERWTGENTASWAGFGAHNPDEISQYVLFQRQQAQQYATEAAAPVNFLQGRIAGSKDVGRTFAKWRGIVDDLQKFNAKVPGTSLSVLEDFIGMEMDKATPDNCQISFLTTVAAGSNYFAQRQEALRRSLYSRCRFLSEQNAVRQYAAIAKLFNMQLAGRFPFAAPTREQTPNEADPGDIEKFYEMLDRSERSIRAGLQKGAFGDLYTPVLGFLNQMDGLRPLFSSILSGQPDAAPAFDFIPAFRVNQNRELNANEIIDWTLQVGTESFHSHDAERTGHWNFGEPVKLALRWAKDSPKKPASVRADDVRLAGDTLSFEYRDSWSLLRMILLHQPRPKEFDRLVDPDPQTLVFSISDTASANSPTSDGDNSGVQAKIFIRIKLRSPGKPDNLRLKDFPKEAPDWTQAQANGAGEGGNSQ